MIKYTLLLAGAALGTFVVALLGAYLLMPSIAPEAMGPFADSLATAGRDTTQQAAMATDTTATPSARDSTGGPARDTTGGPAPAVQRLRDSLTVVARLQDSLRTLRERLRTTEQEATTLRKRVASLESREAKVGELKDALLGMSQRELATVLADVEMKVLRELYQRTSGRTRTQLLQSISAERTAQFVNDVIGGDDASDDTTATDAPSERGTAGASPFR
ncbi:MAG: kinesin [Salinibacter sp.]|uniref:kinesin n=1 Tax=Salinibacter sp. TaxID=2065818 RepID=UPI002FC3B94F